MSEAVLDEAEAAAVRAEGPREAVREAARELGRELPSAGDLLQLLRTGRATTRSDLRRLTGLSRTAIVNRVSALSDAGLVLLGAELASTGGRPPAAWSSTTPPAWCWRPRSAAPARRWPSSTSPATSSPRPRSTRRSGPGRTR
ncbi:hypothetical protein [Nocardioides sambongensis]|uniref:hypothetical protein n=1 Tax=Nocardioides sambongensis TaxID=2589074 RepID=UPI001E3E89F9|nr:hypothetical protein [Nocardioides sambongensis]